MKRILPLVSLVLAICFAHAVDANAAEKKKVVFMAGTKSHGYGSHEHYAGCVLLAKSLEQAMPEIETVVYRNGWPSDPHAFDDADTIVMYCDGGGRHPVNQHLDQIDKLVKEKQVGVVCLHYGVEVPKQPAGEKFLEWIGGYFETNWSVNPHWTANFDKLPMHPITNGVKPFSINDEWYYHMRFPEGMKGVTPILSDLPPKETLQRPDGAHSGNPFVRKAVANGEIQHVAWAFDRPDGGRGFGFTGGHFHWNWGDPNFRKVVLNAIVWTAKAKVPKDGVSDKPVSITELEENQDYPQPKNFNPDSIRERLHLPAAKKKSAPLRKRNQQTAKPVFQSKVVTAKTPGHSVEIDADISGAKQLYLAVTDGGNGFSCDWADWAEPRLVGPAGEEKKLTELKWKSASSQWGNVQVNKNAGGRPLRIAGKSVEYGIGTHANSLIAFDLPKGYVRFKARGGLDNGGSDQGTCGQSASVQFAVYTAQPRIVFASSGGGNASPASHDPEDAIASLDIGEGLEATLFAAEPMLLSPTNIDIDQRGRVWVCEVVNYRGFRNKHQMREKGDRILILEDTNGDGQADKQTVFYQGRDIDSAHGVCVLPTPDGKDTKAIVSAGANVFIFTDTDGDDKADKKEVLFTGIDGVQHDHGIHAFLFGPDGKLYFNFGNAGNRIKDKDGNPIIDMAGNKVEANRRPYQQGMVFRCNPDGSEFETLAWNFRNNWEVAVDSFGTLWQSDNDDDGNRGVRINYVMEFGNYGYRDEMTGAAWKTPRTGMADDIPTRHWHQNDPGVVPNLLQTGAGSPTGLCVYEGSILPKIFQNQMIHCDAGPNIVRAYPVQRIGAGYEAEIVDVLVGTRDKWFRPSGVCAAPDGSVLVADWYDPGVGGHAMGDIQRGRIFRVSAPGHSYSVPKVDVSTIDGAIEALRSPAEAVRYMAWTALHNQASQAEAKLLELFETSKNPRFRARALWLLGKTEGRGKHYVEKAIADENADIRIVGVRLARQLHLELPGIISQLAHDKSAAVRRDCAIALRECDASSAPELWAELASQHDGNDRYYLEALGIAADGRWNELLAAWLDQVDGNWNTAGGRDIVWRSRADKTPELLSKIIRDPKTSTAELPRYFRAFDFQASGTKNGALVELAFSNPADAARQQLIAAESFKRLKGFNVKDQMAALNKALDGMKGTSMFVSLVDKYNVERRYPELLALAQRNPDGQVGVEAIRVLLAKDQRDLIAAAIADKDAAKAASTARVLGNSADGKAVGLLLPIVKEDRWDLELRRQATRAVAKTANGAKMLLALAKAGDLDDRLKSSAAFPLNASPLDEIRNQAAKLFPLPQAKNSDLPPIAQLLKKAGNVGHGQTVFAKTAECAKCHKVNGEGKEVGPDLSEIGKKLSRQALYESILYPSAGISHNYETYLLALNSGNVLTGVLVSEDKDSITIKSDDGIARTFKRDEIEQMKKSELSLMPADLQKKMTTQDLIDVVEYLTTLKKAKK